MDQTIPELNTPPSFVVPLAPEITPILSGTETLVQSRSHVPSSLTPSPVILPELSTGPVDSSHDKSYPSIKACHVRLLQNIHSVQNGSRLMSFHKTGDMKNTWNNIQSTVNPRILIHLRHLYWLTAVKTFHPILITTQGRYIVGCF